MNDTAPITNGRVSSTNPDTTEHVQALWSQFANAASSEAFLRGWLALTCEAMEGVGAALLLLGPADSGPFTVATSWPVTNTDFGVLAGAAEQCLQDRRPVVEADRAVVGGPAHGTRIAYPLLSADALRGAVVVQSTVTSAMAVQELIRALHWSSAWIDAHLLRAAAAQETVSRQRISQVVDLAAIVIDQPNTRAATAALVNEMATRLDCDRVSLGFVSGNRIRLWSISHNASFGKQMNLVRAVEAAMDEALDQASCVALPSADDDTHIVRAHQVLQQQHGSTELLTVPMHCAEEIIGALTLERAARTPFSAQEIELVQGLAAFVGPVLELQRRDDRWLPGKAWLALKDQLARVIGPRYLGRKLILGVLIAASLFLAFATDIHTITADATVEGAIQRAIVAPRNGYISRVEVRPGDVVDKDDVLFVLDDRDLRLERLQVDSKRNQLRTELREVTARRERAKANILAAQIRQADAQLQLLDAEIARTALQAPFDAIVVSGDLSQSLGAPVERGQVLLELAPLNEYRIILAVDERDIDAVQPQLHGALLLASLPGEDFRIQITRVTPVADARDGGNFFRVESRLSHTSPRLRPGMQGIGKVRIGERKLAWIWSHRLAQQIKLWSWKWLP